MKNVSDKTKLLIQKSYEILEEKIPFTYRLFSKNFLLCREESILELLNEIKNSNEPKACIYLAPLILHKDVEIAYQISIMLEDMLKKLSNQDLYIVDQIVRSEWLRWYKYKTFQSWYKLEPNVFKSLNKPSFNFDIFAKFASFHNNGKIREEAIRYLLKQKNGSEIPYLLCRVNDWVQEIHEMSKIGLKLRLNKEYIEYFLDGYYFLEKLSSSSRYSSNTEFVDRIIIFIKRTISLDLLVEKTKSNDIQVKLFAFNILIDSNKITTCEIIDLALQKQNINISTKVILRCLEKLTNEEMMIIFPILKNHRNYKIRSNLLKLLSIKMPDFAKKECQFYFFDKNKSVREISRYYLKDRSISNFSTLYKEKLMDPNITDEILLGSIYGIGETGSFEDIYLLKNYLNSSYPSKIRKAAIKSLSYLSSDEIIDIFITALEDDSLSVSRVAREVLLKKKKYLQPDRFIDIYQKNNKAYIIKNAFIIAIKSSSFWDRIIYILEAYCSESLEINNIAESALNSWLNKLNKVYIKPTNETIQKITSLIERYENTLPLNIRKEIMFVMNYYKNS